MSQLVNHGMALKIACGLFWTRDAESPSKNVSVLRGLAQACIQANIQLA